MKVGTYHNARCIWSPRWNYWFPVYGPWHNDAEVIGLKEWHFHVDWRLVAPSIYRIYENDSRKASSAVFTRQEIGLRGDTDEPATEMKRRRCWREMPIFPAETRGVPVPWMPALEREHCDKKLKCGKVCPHRGFSLEGMPAKEGVVVCPGHGLAWNVETGAMVRRTTGYDDKPRGECIGCGRMMWLYDDQGNFAPTVQPHFFGGEFCSGSHRLPKESLL
jgi:nitrite reductase/ring-hydroxylating ferredoxin subunit